MPLPIFAPILFIVILIALTMNGFGGIVLWIIPLALVGLVILTYLLKRRNSATAPESTSGGRWSIVVKATLYAILIAIVLALVFYADQLMSWFEATGFSFAEDTGLGRLLAEKIGTTATNLIPIVVTLLVVAIIIGRILGVSLIVDLLLWTVLLVIVFAAWLVIRDLGRELTGGYGQEEPMREAPVSAVQYYGLVGADVPMQVTLQAGRWHSFDWPYEHCVRFYPPTGISTQKRGQNQLQLLPHGVDRTVWIRTLEVGESWLPPGGTQRSTCSY